MTIKTLRLCLDAAPPNSNVKRAVVSNLASQVFDPSRERSKWEIYMASLAHRSLLLPSPDGSCRLQALNRLSS